MPKITIFLENNTWCADMAHAERAEEIKELFGAYILRTTFTALSDAVDVADELLRRNPGHEIVVPF